MKMDVQTINGSLRPRCVRVSLRCFRPAGVSPCRPFATRSICRAHDHESKQSYGIHQMVFPSFWLSSLLIAPAAISAEAVMYDPSGGGDFIKNVSGVGYVGLVAFFLYRLLTKRAKKAREERIAGMGSTPAPAPASTSTPEAEMETTPLQAFIGAAQAGGIALGLWIFTVKLQTAIDGTSMPDGYTARNISVTVRTILVGMSYLATFIFSANCVGLTGLMLQLLLFPESAKEDNTKSRPRSSEPQLPKIGITSSPEEVRAAFDMVQRQASESSSRSLPPSSATNNSSTSISSTSSSSSSTSSNR